jgi:hypothetical protein
VGGVFGACTGEIDPQPENCASGKDQDCDGTVTACTGAPAWAEAFGAADVDFVNAVAIDSQGNVIVTGGFADTVNFAEPGAPMKTKTANMDKNDDIFVAKYTSAGKLVWVQAFGAGGDDVGAGVAVDATDNIVVVGRFGMSATFGGTTLMGNHDAFVAMLAPDGTPMWAKAFGDVGMPATGQRADAVAVGASGDIAIVGNFIGSIAFDGTNSLSNAGGMDYDAYVVVLDASGNYKWSQHVYGDAGMYPNGFDWLKGVAFDGMGNVAVTGVVTGNTVTFATGKATMNAGMGNHAVVAEYDPMGNYLWGDVVGDDAPPASPTRLQGNAIAGANGKLVVTGSFDGSMMFPSGSMLTALGTTDVFVAKLDGTNMGQALWSGSFGGTMGMPLDAGNAVAIDQFGNVVVAGSYQGTLTVGASPMQSVIMAKGDTEAFAMKLDSAGVPQWAQAFAGSMKSKAYANGVAVTREPTYVQGAPPPGAAVVGGQFGATMMPPPGTIDFGLPSGALTSAGDYDIFLARLAP